MTIKNRSSRRFGRNAWTTRNWTRFSYYVQNRWRKWDFRRGLGNQETEWGMSHATVCKAEESSHEQMKNQGQWPIVVRYFVNNLYHLVSHRNKNISLKSRTVSEREWREFKRKLHSIGSFDTQPCQFVTFGLKSTFLRGFRAKECIPAFPKASYSPKFWPCDFYLFPKPNSIAKGYIVSKNQTTSRWLKPMPSGS
jgi:hypothetical protein